MVSVDAEHKRKEEESKRLGFGHGRPDSWPNGLILIITETGNFLISNNKGGGGEDNWAKYPMDPDSDGEKVNQPTNKQINPVNAKVRYAVRTCALC